MKRFIILLLLLISASLFSYTPTYIVRVITPNGGEGWRVGSTQKVEWYCDTNADYFDLFYYGSSYSFIARVSGTSRSYNWNIPNKPCNTCELWVWAYWGMAETGDYSDKYFTIYSGSLHLLTPNGGERWKGGTLHDITWSSTGNIPYIRLYFSYNYGMNWSMIAYKVPTSNGKLGWSVPHVNSDYCYIQIDDDYDGFYSDRSDNIFSIYSETGFTESKDSFLPSKNCLSVYPNPLNQSSRVYYTITKASYVDFCLFSVDGRQVWSKSLPLVQSGSYSLELRDIQTGNGVYLLKMKTDDCELTRRIAIIR